MNSPCLICRGACCETVAVPFKSIPQESIDWLNMHKEIKADKSGMRFETKCEHLTDEGKCGIYEKRPQLCRKYKIGSPACLAAINSRRKLKAPILREIRLWNDNFVKYAYR